ncbi:interferon gamma receptor 1 [Fukomys damarensis]|uniref:Interferon gamma receptor 1 n=1 Tax=Fukomys damarensis TaxID=885580 RepID=A0A091EAI0_FUKDA|nr:interferon gamma receptor 1 [Fukomys damarensis]KFO32231.1 Interferon gamma receptor 1 [Fukomys damarensis]
MAVLVLLILLVQSGSKAEMSTVEPEPSSVPVPTNVRIQSYNLNPVLYWDYQSMPQTPVFTVEVKSYGRKMWINACNNTSDHHCNILNVDDPDLPIWAKVKARIGQRESAYVESKDFVICKEGKIGPPKLTVTQEEDHIIIDVIDPVVHLNGEGQEAMYDACYTLIYKVYVRENTSETIMYELGRDDYLYTPCQLKIPVPSLNSEYCVSAEGFLEDSNIITERSKEVCITIHSRSIKDYTYIPMIVGSLFILVILVFAYCYFKKNPCKKKNIMLPKSLLSVVKSATSESKPESKYVSFISSYQPITVENETGVCGEAVSSETVLGPRSKGGEGKEGYSGELSTKIEALTPSESSSDLALTENSVHSNSNQSEPCSVVVSSYHSRDGSDSGLVGSGSFISDSEIPPSNKVEITTEGPEPAVRRSAPTSSGYDKPHMLVDVLVGDGGSKETLLGYRSTTDSKEFS